MEIYKKKCGDIDIQKSNGNLFGQVAVLNCQKNSKWFWKAPEIYQLRFINAERVIANTMVLT